MSEEEKSVKLKVMEALQEEAYKGIVRIDSQTMQDIGVRRGDILEIVGSRLTVGIVDRAYPTDVGQAVIRMDGILRRNAKTGLGEYVTVKKAKIKEAKEVTIAPAQQGVTIQADPIFFKRGLLGRAVVKGDQVALGGARRRRRTMTGSPFEEIFDIFESELSGFGGFGSSLRFIVVQTDPKEAVIITENTKVKVNPKSVDVVDEKLVEVTYEDIGGLREEVKKIREMVELPLRHPEIFERLGVQPPKGVLLHGPPGTGKTLLAKAVANETNAHFIHLDAPAVMCVEGKTEILTNPDGRKTIAEMFEEAEKNGEVIVEDKKKKIIKPKEEINVFAMDDNFNITRDKVKALLKIEAEETYKILTKKKGELKTSKNQPFATLDEEGNIIWKRAEDLKISDYIAIAGEIKANNKNPKINWLEKIDKSNFYTEINREDICLKEIKDDKKITNLKYITLAKNIKSTKPIRPIEEITPDFMELVGGIYSDGWVSNDNVGIADERQEFRDRYRELFHKVFGVEYERIAEKKEKGDAKVLVYSTALSRLLVEAYGLHKGIKPHDIQLPNWIFKCNKDSIASFLRGYYHGDGCEGWSKSNYPTPVFYSKNQEFLKDIQILLLHIGIVSKITYHKNEYGDMWKTVILDTEGRERFYDYVLKDFKNQVTKRWLSNRTRKGSSEKLPDISKLLHELKEKLHIKYGKEINEEATERYISGRNKLTFRKGRYILEQFRKIQEKTNNQDPKIEEKLQLLDNLVSGKIKWDIIKSVQRDGPAILYDFTMETYGNFLGGNPLTVLHNSKYVGEAERKIREIFEEAEKNAPSIIFLDEIDAIASKREESYGEVERRVVAQLLATMDGLKSRGKVIVIAATNRPNSIDPALRRPGRFDREVEIGVPKYEGRLQILKIHTRNMPLAEDVILEELARVTHGFVGADLEAICKEAAMVVLRRILPDLKFQKDEPLPTELLENLEIKFNDFKEALKIVRPSALREVLIEAPNVKWNDIGGLEQIKQQLKEAVEWPLKNPEVFKRLGVRPPRGILLYGPPGTGKTMLAKSVATESEANFILVKGAELLCLDGNTNVFTDFCGVRKIKEAYENMKKISKIIKKNKNIEVRKILQLAHAYAINKKGKIIKTKIEKIYKLWVNNAYKVETADNNEIIVSKNQPFYTFKEGEIKWIKAEDIKEGDFIAKPAKIQTFNKKIVIPLPNYQHLRLIKEDRNNYYVKIFSSKKVTKLPKQLDTKLASFLGWFVSEGNISGHDVLICNENKKNREEIKKLFKMFVENERIQESDKGISVSSTPLIKYMEGIFETKLGTKKSYTITIPPIITKSNKKIISAFIGALYKGDGHIGETKIEYGSMSKSVTEPLNYLLLNFGIKSKFWKRSDGMNMNTISGIREIKKFKNSILNENHSLDVRKEYNAQYIIPKLDKYLKYCKEKLKLHYDKEIKDGSFEHIISGRRKCGLIRLQKLMKIFKKYATREFKKDLIFNTLKQISEGELTWTQVREKIKVEPRIMYDFETQHGSFIGGNVPLVLHNSKWVGDSEKGVKKVFEKARQASPTVIFFDEIDALAPRRGRNSDTNVTERVVNQLLTEIDGLEELNDVVVIGATNRPDIMDPALLRPGRFDRLILTPVPDKDSRVMILEIHTKKMPLAQDVDLHALAEKTVNYVGADIESLCRESAMLALRENMEAYEVKMLHFEKALEKVKPSIREEEIKRYEEIEEDYLQTARSAEINKKDMNYFG